jgi:hypothetical protein
MIKGTAKTEATYRSIMLDSSSSLKEFSMDRKKYYRKYVLGERVEDKDTLAATIGRVVETLLLEPQEFDKRFYMSSCVNAPTGLMLEFVNALCKHTEEATSEDGTINRTFEAIAKDAYVDSGFKIKFDAVIGKFVGSDSEIYYNEMRKVKAEGLTVVTTEDVANAEKIVDELRTNQVTAQIVNLTDSARWQIFNQMQVEGYTVDGQIFKSMMDKVIVDHEQRTIQVYDLKCTWSVENFYEEYYLYRRAYIQAYLYYKAAEQLTFANNDAWGDYQVLPPKFIVCDSTNYFNPLVYQLSLEDLDEAYYGFEHKGRKYPGVCELIKDLKWALENNVWKISRTNYLSNGVVNIKG